MTKQEILNKTYWFRGFYIIEHRKKYNKKFMIVKNIFSDKLILVIEQDPYLIIRQEILLNQL